MSPRYSVWPDQQTRTDNEYYTCSRLTGFQGNKCLLEPWVKHYCDILTSCKKEYDTGQHCVRLCNKSTLYVLLCDQRPMAAHEGFLRLSGTRAKWTPINLTAKMNWKRRILLSAECRGMTPTFLYLPTSKSKLLKSLSSELSGYVRQLVHFFQCSITLENFNLLFCIVFDSFREAAYRIAPRFRAGKRLQRLRGPRKTK